MSLADTYKSVKNRELIYTACFKMIRDKFQKEVDDTNNIRFKNIANNIITSIGNDVILMRSNVNINEINNRTLVKIKEYLDNNPSIFSEDVDDLTMKLQELEEKRKISNIILQDAQNPDADSSQAVSIESTQTSTQQIPLSPQTDIKLLTDAIFKITEKQKVPVYKNLVINSHNRDWVNNPTRNSLKFNINIDVYTHTILPHAIYFVPSVKDLTPYVAMHISDGARTQKYNFVYNRSCGSWDEWRLLLPSVENISLKNKTWNISFWDYMNKELALGSDDISVSTVKLDERGFLINIEYSRQYSIQKLQSGNVLLKTRDNDIENVKLEKISDEEYLVYNDNELQQEDFINSCILNLKEQYTIVLSYYLT